MDYMDNRGLENFNKVLRLSIKLMKQLERKETKNPYEELLVMCLSGSTRILSSIKLLNIYNFPEDAMVLLRNLLELLIDLEYIKLDKRRAEQFIEFTTFKMASIFEKPDSKLLLRYGNQFKNKIKWSQVSLGKMLDDISSENPKVAKIFKGHYKMLCMYSHPSALALGTGVGFCSGDYRRHEIMKNNLKGILRNSSPLLALLILDRINNEFNLENEKEIKSIFKSLPREKVNS